MPLARAVQRRPRVVIVGAGFGGLWTAKKLAGRGMNVTLIDRNNFHTFMPLLYQVAAAELEPGHVAYPVRKIFRNVSDVRFMTADVRAIHLDQRVVQTDKRRVAYDYLVLAAGSRTNFFNNESIARHAFGMKDLVESTNLRYHILSSFEEAMEEKDAHRRRGLLTFVVVGGGPTGVEFAATLSELVWHVLAKDYPRLDLTEARVLLVEAMDQVLPSFPPKLQRYTRRVLEKKGVDVRVGTAVRGATQDAVELQDGTVLASRTLVWTAGVRSNCLADDLGVEQGPGGRIVVNECLQLPNAPEVFVIGDMALTQDERGAPVPQVAPVAIQQGMLTAENIVRDYEGRKLKRFRYLDRGAMITIGRNRGAARIGRRSFRGWPAWIAWLVVHLVRLVGFRNRFVVLAHWAWNYVFNDRVPRLVMK